MMNTYPLSACTRVPTLVLITLLSAGCKTEWDTTQHPVRDEELESAFFAGLNAVEVPDVGEPTRLRPCCIFANDAAVSVGAIPVPGYEVRNVLDNADRTFDLAAQIGRLPATVKEYTQTCGNDLNPLGLEVPDRLGDVPFRETATLEFRPGETVIKNGVRFPKSGSDGVTPDDFPAVIEAIVHERDTELGPGAGSPAARPNEPSRKRG